MHMHSTPLYSTLLYSTLLHSILLYSTLLYSTLLYSTPLYYILLRLLWSVLLGTRNLLCFILTKPRPRPGSNSSL